jgi:hypothetical protein
VWRCCVWGCLRTRAVALEQTTRVTHILQPLSPCLLACFLLSFAAATAISSSPRASSHSPNHHHPPSLPLCVPPASTDSPRVTVAAQRRKAMQPLECGGSTNVCTIPSKDGCFVCTCGSFESLMSGGIMPGWREAGWWSRPLSVEGPEAQTLGFASLHLWIPSELTPVDAGFKTALV